MRTAATLFSVIATCECHGIGSMTPFRDVLTRILFSAGLENLGAADEYSSKWASPSLQNGVAHLGPPSALVG
jgi:hypothetical protein